MDCNLLLTRKAFDGYPDYGKLGKLAIEVSLLSLLVMLLIISVLYELNAFLNATCIELTTIKHMAR